MEFSSDWTASLGIVLLLVAAGALAAAGFLLWRVYRGLSRLNVPAGADFLTTLRAVPLSLVVALDLLDFALDFLAIPIVWTVLSRFRLQRLRDVATVEALVPFTQPIPFLTLAWLVARWLKLGSPPSPPGARPAKGLLP